MTARAQSLQPHDWQDRARLSLFQLSRVALSCSTAGRHILIWVVLNCTNRCAAYTSPPRLPRRPCSHPRHNAAHRRRHAGRITWLRLTHWPPSQLEHPAPRRCGACRGRLRPARWSRSHPQHTAARHRGACRSLSRPLHVSRSYPQHTAAHHRAACSAQECRREPRPTSMHQRRTAASRASASSAAYRQQRGPRVMSGACDHPGGCGLALPCAESEGC